MVRTYGNQALLYHNGSLGWHKYAKYGGIYMAGS